MHDPWHRGDRRATWRDNAVKAGFAPKLHFIDVPLEAAVERAAERVVTVGTTALVLHTNFRGITGIRWLKFVRGDPPLGTQALGGSVIY